MALGGGEFAGFIIILSCFPTQQNLVNRKHPYIYEHYLVLSTTAVFDSLVLPSESFGYRPHIFMHTCQVSGVFVSFFLSIPFIVFTRLVLLPPSSNSGPGSHNRFSPPRYFLYVGLASIGNDTTVKHAAHYMS